MSQDLEAIKAAARQTLEESFAAGGRLAKAKTDSGARISADLDPSMSPPYGLPSTRSVYQVCVMLSTDAVQETEIRVG